MMRFHSFSSVLIALAALGLAAAPALALQQGDEPAQLRGDQLQDDFQPRRPGALSSEPGSVLLLRGLDKVTARTRDFEAPIGESVVFGPLTITARYCRKRPPEETPEIYAFVEIDDRRTDGFGVEAEGDRIFNGWMFGSNPALNPLEHPVYDVWVIDCRA